MATEESYPCCSCRPQGSLNPADKQLHVNLATDHLLQDWKTTTSLIMRDWFIGILVLDMRCDDPVVYFLQSRL